MIYPNFKIGQRVQFELKSFPSAALSGATAVVTSLKIMPDYITVRWIKNALWRNQDNGNYYPIAFNIKFKPLKPFLDKALKDKKITTFEYFELLESGEK